MPGAPLYIIPVQLAQLGLPMLWWLQPSHSAPSNLTRVPFHKWGEQSSQMGRALPGRARIPSETAPIPTFHLGLLGSCRT